VDQKEISMKPQGWRMAGNDPKLPFTGGLAAVGSYLLLKDSKAKVNRHSYNQQ
jgi:hypothetical protein